jgi:hypothetical protein
VSIVPTCIGCSGATACGDGLGDTSASGMCSKALRRLATIRKEADAAARRAARAEGRPPKTPTVDVPRHPLCWECNDSIDPDQEHRIVKLRNGQVSVHLQCVNFIDDAELGDEASDVVAEGRVLLSRRRRHARLFRGRAMINSIGLAHDRVRVAAATHFQ